MRRAFWKFYLFTLLRWKIVGTYHHEVPKQVVLAAPHTSNWDFPMGLASRAILRADIRYVAKASIFKWPVGGLLKWMGGIPVKRGAGGFTQAVIDLFDSREELAVNIAPEGTRKRVEKFKSGFWHIAKGAGAAITLVAFDWKNRTMTWEKPFYLTDDKEADMKRIEDYYRGIIGYHPESSFF